MQNRQVTVPGLPLVIELKQRVASVRLLEGPAESWSFHLRRVGRLTERAASADILTEGRDEKPLLVYFDDASPQARALLREHRISFLGDDGSCFLFAPPLMVDRELPRSRRGGRAWQSPSAPPEARNPFSRTGSRVLRWLLLHPEEKFNMQILAEETGVSRALVSRVVRTLAEEAWVEVGTVADDRRVRSVRMRRPRQALTAWSQDWDRRRIMTESWDIRAEGHDAIVQRLRKARKRMPRVRWALGGVAGAYYLRRAVEPAGALLWVSALDLDTLERTLRPVRTSRSGGQLRIAIAPDDFIFELAWAADGIPVADPVQLWLDCHGEGERALEAADAIAEEMSW